MVSFSESKDLQRRTIQQEERPMEEEKEEGYLTNSTIAGPEEPSKKNHSKSPGAIRTLADMFKQVDAEEDKREDFAVIEEQELGFKPDQDGPEAGKVLFDVENPKKGKKNL